MDLKQQIRTILETCPEARECNLTLYNALCNEYYNDLSEDWVLFQNLSVIEYLRRLKNESLPHLHDVIKIRKQIRI